MLITTVLILILIVSAALVFEDAGSEITIGVATLLWIILGSFITGTAWMVVLLVSLVDGRIRKWTGSR